MTHPSPSTLLRTSLAFLIAAGVGYVLAAVFATTATLMRLSGIGAEISAADTVRTLLFDLRGMAPTAFEWRQYGSLIFIGLAIAFPVAALLHWQISRAGSAVRRISPFLYPASGVLAMIVILVCTYSQYEVFMVAGARGTLGVLAQCVAGALAGFLFHMLLSKFVKVAR